MTTNIQSSIESELMRFFIAGKAFQSETNKPVFMPACIVDQIWHELMQDEIMYKNLCLRTVDQEVEHLQNKGEGKIEWVSTYEKMFGKLSKHWFTSTSGNFDALAYDNYLKTGKLYAAWDCSPGYKQGEKIKPKNQVTVN